MKKAINLIIIAVLVFSLLTACSNNGNPPSNSSNPPSNSGNPPSNSGNPPSNNGNNDPSTSQVNISDVDYITDFSNGLAFIQYKDEQKTAYCIDKTGKQLFKLENVYVSSFAKFNDKIAMVETSTSREYIICDKTGKVYNAEDFGASRIVLDTDDHKQAFGDGYIILERKEESYTGTKIEMSIIDSNFTTLVPFSAELAEIINSDEMSSNGTAYYNGYLYERDSGTSATILDLRSGTLLSDTTQMNVSKPLLSYRADDYGSRFTHLEWGDIYNELTGEVVAKVKDYEFISKISFVDNFGLATYRTDNGIWFNIIESNGTAKFEPIKAESRIYFDGETILVVGDAGFVEKEGVNVRAYSLKTYDVNGILLGEIIVGGTEYYLPSVTLSDGVIRVNSHDKFDNYSLYNSKLEELF